MQIAVNKSLGSDGRWLFPKREFFWAKLVDRSKGGFWSSEGGTFLRYVGNRSPCTQRYIPEHRNPRLHRSENLGTRRSEDCPTSGWFFFVSFPSVGLSRGKAEQMTIYCRPLWMIGNSKCRIELPSLCFTP